MAACLALDAKDGLTVHHLPAPGHMGAIPGGHVVRDANDQALADNQFFLGDGDLQYGEGKTPMNPLFQNLSIRSHNADDRYLRPSTSDSADFLSLVFAQRRQDQQH